MPKKMLFIIIFMLFFSQPENFAAEKSEKMDLILKFTEVSGIKTNYEKTLLNMNNQMKQYYLSRWQEMLNQNKDLDPEKEKRIMTLINESLDRIYSEFNSYMLKEAPFEKVFKEIYYPIYAEHFKVDEIRNMIIFFETDTGKKLASQTPKIMQKSMTDFNNLYGQSLIAKMSSLTEQEGKSLSPRIDSLLNNDYQKIDKPGLETENHSETDSKIKPE